MAKRKLTALTQEEAAARQAEEFKVALKALDTPIGRALRKPGATFRYWSGSSPANIWVQSRSGRYAFHSEESWDCPVKESFRNLRPFLKGSDASQGGGEQVFVLDEGLVAEFERRRMDKRLGKAEAEASPKPKARF